MVLETLRDRIKEGRGEGKEIKEIVEGMGLCDPPSTDIFRIGRYHPETKTVTGARYEEDGDQKDWGPVELSRILEYYDFKTFGAERLYRREVTHVPSSASAVFDIGN